MKFIYYNLGENYLKNIENNDKTLIIFNDYFSKNTFLKNRKKNILIPNGTYLTLDEFQKEIFITNKIVLTEAKRPITLYKALSSDTKSYFKIKSYYDIIDIADLFFTFYKELNINLVSKIDNNILTEWQKEKIENFDKMKKEYDEFLEKNNFIISDWIICEKNFKNDFIKKFQKIIFVDILSFSPLLKKILDILDKETEINFILQGNKSIYDENKLSLKKIFVADDYFKFNENKIKIYETNENLETILNTLYLLKKENFQEEKIKNIYFPKIEDEYFSKMMPKYFINSKLQVMENTNLYEFMTLQNDLLNSFEEKKYKGVSVENLLDFIENRLTQKIYNISSDIKKDFYKILEKDYRFVNLDIFESFNTDENRETFFVFNSIYNDILKIKKFNTIENFYEYFKGIGFEKISDEIYIDFIEKFHEVVFSIKSSEILLGKNGFKEIFKKDSGKYIYTLFIKYLEGIELKTIENEKNKDIIGMIKKIDDSKLNFGESSYFIDINSNSFPGNIEKNKIFSDKQLEVLGFTTREEKINLIKYRFLQSIGNSKESIIFYKKEKNGKVGKSIFVEELITEYNLKTENKIINNENIINILEEYFYKERNFETLNKDFNLKKDLTKITNQNNQIQVGAYDIVNMKDCQYKYFLNNICNLKKTEEVKYGGSVKVLGSIVHSILEEITNKVYYKIIKEKDFNIDKDLVKKVIQNQILKNTMKYPTYMDLYFEKILIPTLEKNIIDFYKQVEKIIGDEKIKTFFSEKDKTYLSDYNENNKTKPDFLIKNRIDLLITTDTNNYIIDYKTGSTTDGQLDIYSIVICGDSEKAKKYIYNVISAKLSEPEKSKITKETLNKIFDDFVTEENYTRKDKSCRNCEYKNICRKDVVYV